MRHIYDSQFSAAQWGITDPFPWSLWFTPGVLQVFMDWWCKIFTDRLKLLIDDRKL